MALPLRTHTIRSPPNERLATKDTQKGVCLLFPPKGTQREKPSVSRKEPRKVPPPLRGENGSGGKGKRYPTSPLKGLVPPTKYLRCLRASSRSTTGGGVEFFPPQPRVRSQLQCHKMESKRPTPKQVPPQLASPFPSLSPPRHERRGLPRPLQPARLKKKKKGRTSRRALLPARFLALGFPERKRKGWHLPSVGGSGYLWT